MVVLPWGMGQAAEGLWLGAAEKDTTDPAVGADGDARPGAEPAGARAAEPFISTLAPGGGPGSVPSGPVEAGPSGGGGSAAGGSGPAAGRAGRPRGSKRKRWRREAL